MKTKTFRAIIWVYVDGLTISASNISGVLWVETKLRFLFKMEDLGDLRYYVGVSFKQNGIVMFCIKLPTVNVLWKDPGWIGQSQLQRRL